MLNRVRFQAEVTCGNVHQGIFSSKDSRRGNYQLVIFLRCEQSKIPKQNNTWSYSSFYKDVFVLPSAKGPDITVAPLERLWKRVSV